VNSGRVAPFFVAVLAVSALLLSLLLPADAHAGGWTEVHQTSDDVRVSVGADGVAIFEYRMRWRIVAGKFRSLDVGGIDLRAALEPEATVSSEKGGDHIARVERDAKAPDTVHIFVDAPAKWLGRGVYLVDIRYKLDLVAAKILTRDGGMWRLAWTAPPALEGRDGARVVFELPTAPTEPRLANAEQVQTTLATLRRLPDGDELELVRAHVPRGEAVTWAARVDPKAFPAVTTPELRPPPPPAQAARAADRTPAVLSQVKTWLEKMLATLRFVELVAAIVAFIGRMCVVNTSSPSSSLIFAARGRSPSRSNASSVSSCCRSARSDKARRARVRASKATTRSRRPSNAASIQVEEHRRLTSNASPSSTPLLRTSAAVRSAERR